MRHDFTPAAIRAISSAAGWASREGSDELEAPALLLGLLVEPECRAAIMLVRRGIDASAVCRRWPQLQRQPPLCGGIKGILGHFSEEVESSLLAVCERLAAYPRPLTLATEHLLLGLAAAEHEVSQWLRQHGLEPNALEAEIHQLYGHQSSPLPLEPEIEQCCTTQNTVALSVEAGVKDQEPESGCPHPNPLPEGDGTMGPHPNPLPDGEGTIGAHPNPISEGEGTTGVHPDPRAADQVGLLRAIDAAANRGREGLRAIDDYVRFVLDDRHLTEQCKRLRHDLAAALHRVSSEHRLAARETQADVGTALTAPSEICRAGMADVLHANFARLQESLRSLEEFGKLVDAGMAATLKQLRYRSYTLQRAVEITCLSLQRLTDARLYVLIDGRSSPQQFEQLVRSLVEVGVHVIQLRDKQLDDRRLLDRARVLREATRGTSTLFIMNDRPDLAVLSRADGVHLGQEELSVKDVRTIVGPDALVGVSAHSIEQARRAVLDGANYIGVGPTFPSGTKQFAAFAGVELLGAVAAEIRLPAFAIGGITAANLPEVLAAGLHRAAVSGAITTASDPAAAARELLGMLGLTPTSP